MDFEKESLLAKTNNLSFRTCPTQTELYSHWPGGSLKLKKKGKFTTCVAKTKALISCAVTAQLICGFVFAYADRWFLMHWLKC